MTPGLLSCPWKALGAITSTLGSHLSLPLPQKACKIFSASLWETGRCFKPGARSQWHTAVLSLQMWAWNLCCSLQKDGCYSNSRDRPQSTFSHPLPEPSSQDQTTLLQQVWEGAARAVLTEGTLQDAAGHCGAPRPGMGRASGETTAGREVEESRKSLVLVLWFKLCTQGVLWNATEVWNAAVGKVSCPQNSQ